MSEPFPILDVRREMVRDVEQLGSKPKVWFEWAGERWLFKEARGDTGEDWAEKVASEIASLLGLPTHRAELAVREGRPGCAVRSFLDAPRQVLVHGNELLGGMITGYDKEKQRGQCDHTFDNIVAVIERLFPGSRARTLASARITGYLVLDALIGNTDRHHQNWGVILEPRRGTDGILRVGSLQLAPTFDHASSLGRELTEEARQRHLAEGSLERYARRARGGIFGEATARHGLSPIATVERLAARYPDFFRPWQRKVENLKSEKLESLVRRVPSDRMSASAAAFVLAFVESNRKLILAIP